MQVAVSPALNAYRRVMTPRSAGFGSSGLWARPPQQGSPWGGAWRPRRCSRGPFRGGNCGGLGACSPSGIPSGLRCCCRSQWHSAYFHACAGDGVPELTAEFTGRADPHVNLTFQREATMVGPPRRVLRLCQTGTANTKRQTKSTQSASTEFVGHHDTIRRFLRYAPIHCRGQPEILR